MKECEDEDTGIQVNGRYINTLRYAGDLVYIGTTEGELQGIVERINKSGSLLGMKIHAKNIKCMVISKNYKGQKMKLKIDGIETGYIQKYRYLRSLASGSRKDNIEIKSRMILK